MLIIKYTIVSIIILLFLPYCTDRHLNPSDDHVEINDITNGEFLETISADFIGDTVIIDEKVFVNGLFKYYESQSVWAVFIEKDGKTERLSWQLSLDQPVPFFMYTDKFTNEWGRRHLAVSVGVPQDFDHPIENIRLAVSVSDDEQVMNKYFRVIQPDIFGNINNTPYGEFIEAFFIEIEPEEVWAIRKTIPQGTKLKINFRRWTNYPPLYYLFPDSTADSTSVLKSGITIGLPYDDIAPLQNIDILVPK